MLILNSMDIFEMKDYRELLNDYFNSTTHRSRGVKAELADKLNVHSSHLSQIMNGQRSLTPDQALEFSKILGLSELETEYLMYLVHQERAVSFEFKNYCKSKLSSIQSKALKAEERFSHQKQLSEEHKSLFYSHYLYSAIRLFCSTSKKGKSIDEILLRFDISRERLMPLLRFLLECGLLMEANGFYTMGTSSTFITRESPHIHKHHTNWRLLALQTSNVLEEKEIMFTAPMSISKKDFLKIQNELMNMISKLSETIKESEAEEIACLNLDFFKIRR